MGASDQTAAAEQMQSPRVAQLDQGIWARLRDGGARADFVNAWLTLQCRMIGGAERAVALFGSPVDESLTPVAVWPEDAEFQDLASIAKLATTQRRGVLQSDERTGAAQLAFPFLARGEVHGAVALQIEPRSRPQTRVAMRQLQWGTAWIELLVHRERVDAAEASQARAGIALDLIAAALEQEGFAASVTAVATELAARLGCERVSIGWIKGEHARIVALSHSAEIGHRLSLARAIGQAMDEATDQGTTLLYVAGQAPAGAWVTRAHAELLRLYGAAAVLTVPLDAGQDTIGAITLEAADAGRLDTSAVELVEAVAAVLAPILTDRHANDQLLLLKVRDSAEMQLGRLIGPGYTGRKLALGALAAVAAFFALFTTEYRVTAEAMLEGQVRRVLAAPFDGYVSEEQARPGDIVRTGQVLASLDDRDLIVERVGALAERRQRQLEYDAALANGKRADLNILDAQMRQIDARVALIDAQLTRARLVAPFDSVVVAGDLSQSIGAAVSRGQALFEIAPLADYRVVLKVDERDVIDVSVGQRGELKIAPLPDRLVPFTVTRITPVSEADHGQNRFRVEGVLAPDVVASDGARLLPGMQGIGKVVVGERRLIWIWTHRAFEWLRVAVWSLLP